MPEITAHYTARATDLTAHYTAQATELTDHARRNAVAAANRARKSVRQRARAMLGGGDAARSVVDDGEVEHEHDELRIRQRVRS